MEFRRRSTRKEVSLEVPLDSEAKTTLRDVISDSSASPDEAVEKEDLKNFVYGLLSKLDPRYKEVLLLCDAEGLTYEEAAKILKTNVKTVGTRARKSRELFYKILKEHKSEL